MTPRPLEVGKPPHSRIAGQGGETLVSTLVTLRRGNVPNNRMSRRHEEFFSRG
jgi:hypothetical protein